MDPLYEQRLRDEVIYLHSLWHQGPPRAISGPSNNLQPSKTTEFKKVNKRRGKRGKKARNKPDDTSRDFNSISGPEWPCPSPPPPRSSWACMDAQPNTKPHSLSPEEQSRVAVRVTEHHVVKAVLEFFKKCDSDDPDKIYDSSDEDDEFMKEDDGREEYSFFCKVFMEDAELSEHYKKNFVQGDFSCLVCSAVGGKKTGKRYKGCLALIQHSITVANTTKRRAHRAFGQAVCKVLGWDIDQLPAIVSALHDKAGGMQGGIKDENKENSVSVVGDVCPVECITSETGLESESDCNGVLVNCSNATMTSLPCPCGDNNLEDLAKLSPLNVEEPAAEGVMITSLPCPGGDNNLEDLAKVGPHNVEEPAAEGVMITSLPLPAGNNNLEDLANLSPLSVEEPVAEGVMTTSLPGDRNFEDIAKLSPLHIEQPASESLMINSLMCSDGNNNSEDFAMQNLHNVEEHAGECLTIGSSMCPDGDDNNQDLAPLCPHKVDEPATEDLTSNSLTCPGVDNLEDLDVLRPLNVQEPAAGGLMIILQKPASENNDLGH